MGEVSGIAVHFLFNYFTIVIGDLEIYEVPWAVWDKLKAAARALVRQRRGGSWMHQGGELFRLSFPKEETRGPLL